MDDRTCHTISGTQFVEKNKVLCEKVLSRLLQIKDILDRPLRNFTEDYICEVTEQLHAMLKSMRGLPAEILQEYIPSRVRNAILQALQNTIIELTLALDQLSSPENKAAFYKHILLAQAYFTEIFVDELSEKCEFLYTYTDPPPTSIIKFPARQSVRQTSLHDFTNTILPDMYTLFQDLELIHPEQCERAIVHMHRLNALLEKQKRMQTLLSDICDSNYAVVACRLMVALAYASELTHKLIIAFTAMQEGSRTKSRRTARLREEILYCLTLFIHNFEAISQNIQDQERFRHEETEWERHKIISIRG